MGTRCCVYLRSLVLIFLSPLWGLFIFSLRFPRLAPWAAFFRRLAACLLKTLGVITPTAGARSRAIRVSCLKRPGIRMSLWSSLAWGGLQGPSSFLGLRGGASGPYAIHSTKSKILSHGHSSHEEVIMCGKSLGCVRTPSHVSSSVEGAGILRLRGGFTS